MVTPPHSPLPWTVNETGDIVDADGAEMVIAEDGAIYPEDRRLIVIAVNNYEKMRKALEIIVRKPIGAYDGARVREIARAALAWGVKE